MIEGTYNPKKNKLTPSDLEDGLRASGSNNRYQFFLVFIFFFVKLVTDSFFSPLPYLEMDPKIECLNPNNNTYTPCTLSETCKNNKDKPFEDQIKYQLAPNVSKDYSFISGFDLYCDSFKIGFIASSAAIGNLISNIVGPLMTENLGRVPTLTMTFAFDILSKGSLLFFRNYYGLIIVMLLTSLNNNIIYNAVGLYLNEMVDCKKRGTYSCWFNALFGISGIIYTVIFNLSFNWKALQVFSVITSAISLLLTFFFVKESIRYSYAKRDYHQLYSTLEYIASFNKRKEEYSRWKLGIENRNTNYAINEVDQSFHQDTTNPIFLIFKRGKVIYNFITFGVVSMVTICALIYNAIEIRTTTDTFLFPIIFYFTDFLIILTAGYIIDMPYFGRKLPTLVFSGLATVFYFVKFGFIVNTGENVSIFWVDYLVRISVSISFNILIQYNFEIYSTDIRATAYNINKLFSRIGDFTLPLILSANRSLATVLIGASYLIMSVLILFVKETRGMKLKETIYEEDQMEPLHPEDKNELSNLDDSEKLMKQS